MCSAAAVGKWTATYGSDPLRQADPHPETRQTGSRTASPSLLQWILPSQKQLQGWLPVWRPCEAEASPRFLDHLRGDAPLCSEGHPESLSTFSRLPGKVPSDARRFSQTTWLRIPPSS